MLLHGRAWRWLPMAACVDAARGRKIELGNAPAVRLWSRESILGLKSGAPPADRRVSDRGRFVERIEKALDRGKWTAVSARLRRAINQWCVADAKTEQQVLWIRPVDVGELGADANGLRATRC